MKPQLSSGNRAFGHVLGGPTPVCPCPALSGETVVVNRWAALIAVGVLTAAGYYEAALSLQTALEKKP